MAQVNEKDVVAIKNWLAQELYLPKKIDDIIIKKFLYSCDSSLERTKRCIEEFCSSRASMSEIFSDRDPGSARMKNVFTNTHVTTYLAGTDEILVHKLITADNFDFYDSLKAFMIHADNWIRLEKDVLSENHKIILDTKVYTLALVAKANIFYFQKFILFLLAAMPVRLKQVHIVNCPSFYEYMYGLIKGVLPQEIRDMIVFHSDHMGLHKYIDKKYLPSEYGGDAESMKEQNEYWTKILIDNRKFLGDDNLWKADLTRKSKKTEVETNMSGSFRTLAID